MSKRHLNVRVSGKVQGVFFRASAKEQADQLGVKGFVRNEPNGNVYLEAEGDENQLKLFLEWCARGPKRAQVTQVTSEESALMTIERFEVRR
jgi:acylphosphatase